MAMFRNAKKRGGNLFSDHGMENSKGRGMKPANRRARVLNLESLENRQLLSVSPGVSPDEVSDLGLCATQSDTYTEETALVSTLDPAADSSAVIGDAVLEVDVAADVSAADDGVAEDIVAEVSAADETGTAPALTNDSFAMTSSQQLGAGVLANDVDADGDALVVTLDSDVSHGQLNLDSNGLFTYRPDSDFNGIDSFTYTVSDGVNESGPATVSIEVTGVENQAPEAVEDAYSLAEDDSLTVSRSDGLLSNDADAEDDPLYANLVDAPAHGTLTVGRYGSFTYTPDADFNGTDQFTYMANDLDGDSEPTTVTLTVNAVNDAPVSAADTYTTSEDTTLTVDTTDGVLANDTDVDGDTLSVRLVQEPSHGTVTLADDGSFEYTPEPDFFGEDSFTYVAGDGQIDTEVASVTIFVEAVNDGPAAAADSYFTTEDGSLTVDAADGVLANDTDVEGDFLTAALVDQPAHGTVTLAEDGSFEYTPEAGFSGEDSFTYVTSDGEIDAEPASVTIFVEAVNDAPVAAADSYFTTEDGSLTVDAADGVLANDTDADGDILTATLVDEPAHGTVALAEDGSFEYTPEAGFSGEDSFTYVTSDGEIDSEVESVTIFVEAVNDAPLADADSYSTTEDGVLTVDAADGVLANDTDEDGDILTASLVDEPAHGTVALAEDGSFVYTPEAGFSGEDSFTYVTSDGQAESATTLVAIAVESINEAPVSAADAYSVAENGVLTVDTENGVLANDVDADGDTLSATLVDQPAHGTVILAEDGSFEYTPEAGFSGEDSFTYVAGDGQAESEGTTVAITVEAASSAPVSAADTYVTSEDAILTVDAADGVLANDTGAVTASLADEPSHGTVTLAEDGSFVYTPEPDYYGEDSFTYLASDGEANGELNIVTVTVEAVNDAPQSVADAYSTSRGDSLTVDASEGVLANDTDVEGDALSVQLVDSPSHGTVVLAEDGSFEYTPEDGFSGTDTFTYVTSDGQAESEASTVSVEVAGAQLSIQLQVTSKPFGEQVDTLWTDSTFWVSVSVEDLSDLGLGVIGGAIDLAYDASAVTPTGEVVYGDAFSLFQQGDTGSEEGLIDETGALTATAGVGAGEAAQFVSWQFTRTGAPSTFATSSVQFSVDAAEGTSTILPANFALTGSGDAVDWADVEMGSTDLDLIFADFNGDQVIDHFDLALWVPHSGTSADSVAYQSMFDLNSDSAIDQADLDLLSSAMYTLSGSSESSTSVSNDELDEGPAGADTLADLDSGLEGISEETDPTLAIDGLFASDDLWA